MKNKKIYKILTVILLTVTLFSLLCTNVCAFGKLNNYITEIPGEREYDTPYFNIYNDDYALIDCGRIDRELTHVPGENVSWDSFVTLPSLQAFLSDMTDENAKYGETTIDRIDNNKGYSPENCRIANETVQSNNRRTNRKISYKGETHTVAEWARILDVKQSTLITGLNNGRTIDFYITKHKPRNTHPSK